MRQPIGRIPPQRIAREALWLANLLEVINLDTETLLQTDARAQGNQDTPPHLDRKLGMMSATLRARAQQPGRTADTRRLLLAGLRRAERVVRLGQQPPTWWRRLLSPLARPSRRASRRTSELPDLTPLLLADLRAKRLAFVAGWQLAALEASDLSIGRGQSGVDAQRTAAPQEASGASGSHNAAHTLQRAPQGM